MSAFDLDKMMKDLLRRVHVLETTQPLGHSSVSRGQTRFVGPLSILVEGSGRVDGTWIIVGTQQVDGRLEGSGTLDWTGPWFLRGLGEISGALDLTGPLKVLGTWDFQGNGQIKGDVDITGALDVLNRLSLGPSGFIEAGSVRIDRGGSYGGRVASTGPVLALAATGSVIVDAPFLTANDASFVNAEVLGVFEAGDKRFKISHPVKPDHVLRHGSTESPVSGVEYWGDETLPESGELEVALPTYFDALTKPENRVVLVTARGFVADWGDIEDGTFTVYGKPGGRFTWLVKAERFGADFLVEESTEDASTRMGLPGGFP